MSACQDQLYQEFPTWSRSTPGGTSAYLKGHIYCTAAQS